MSNVSCLRHAGGTRVEGSKFSNDLTVDEVSQRLHQLLKSHHALTLKLIRFHLITSPPVRPDAAEHPNARPSSCQWLGWLYTPPRLLRGGIEAQRPMSKSARGALWALLPCSQTRAASVDPWCQECRNTLWSSGKGTAVQAEAFDQGGRAGARCYPPPYAKTQRLYWFWIMLCVSSRRGKKQQQKKHA